MRAIPRGFYNFSMGSHEIDDALACQDQAAEAAARLDFGTAIELAQRAAAIVEKADGFASPDLANLLTDLASYLDQAARYQEARKSAERAHGILEGLAPSFPGDEILAQLRLNALGQLGTALRNSGDLAGAEHSFRQALTIAAESFGESSRQTAGAHTNLGVVYKYAERFEEARSHYDRALVILEDLHGRDSLETATVWHNIGGLFHAEGRFEEAEAPGRRAWEIRRNYAGGEAPETWFDAVAYAGILDGLGRYPESEPIYREALARFKEWFGPEHFEVAAVLNNLAHVLARRGDFQAARETIRESLAIKEKLFPQGHFEIGITESGIEAIEELARN